MRFYNFTHISLPVVGDIQQDETGGACRVVCRVVHGVCGIVGKIVELAGNVFRHLAILEVQAPVWSGTGMKTLFFSYHLGIQFRLRWLVGYILEFFEGKQMH
jgi:hypothetical protein